MQIVKTEITEARKFYMAARQHQQHLLHQKHGYCVHSLKFKWEDCDYETIDPKEKEYWTKVSNDFRKSML